MTDERQPKVRKRRRISIFTVLALLFGVAVFALLLIVVLAATGGVAGLVIPLDALPAALAILALRKPRTYSRPLVEWTLGCLGIQWFGMVVLNFSHLPGRNEYIFYWAFFWGAAAWIMALLMDLRRVERPKDCQDTHITILD